MSWFPKINPGKRAKLQIEVFLAFCTSARSDLVVFLVFRTSCKIRDRGLSLALHIYEKRFRGLSCILHVVQGPGKTSFWRFARLPICFRDKYTRKDNRFDLLGGFIGYAIKQMFYDLSLKTREMV